jgi:hypothetical protein
MSKKKIFAWVMSVLLLIGACITACASLSYALFIAKEKEVTNSSDFTGYINTAQYFDSGSGSETDPYIITRPRHLYNLSRLTAFGLFSASTASKQYFQLGKLVGSSYYVYAEDGTLSATVLDMTSKSSSSTSLLGWSYSSFPFYPIGSEVTPFYGTFNGENLTIKGLEVTGNQEDIGVFGYISSKATVENVNFNKLQIKSYGAASSDVLYSSAYQASTSYTTAKLVYGSTDIGTIVSTGSIAIDNSTLLRLNINGTTQTNLEYTDTFTSDASSTKVTYSYVSGYNTVLNSNGTFNIGTDVNTNVLNTTSISAGQSFTNPFYIIASYTDENHNYLSTVVKTYDMVIKNDAGTIKIDSCAERTDTHGFNIGYIAGHCDGTISSSYVKDISTDSSSISINSSYSGFTGKAHNSDFGLIGLVSPNHKANALVDTESSGNIYDKELKADVDTFSTDLTNGQSLAFSPFTIYGVAKFVENQTMSMATLSTTGYTNYYDTSTSTFNFPTSYTRGDISYTFRSSTYNYPLNASHNVYQFDDFTNRTNAARCIKFTSEGAGILIVLFASKNSSSSKYMLMKTPDSLSTNISASGIVSSYPNTADNGAFATYSNIYAGRAVFGNNAIAKSPSSANAITFCYFEIPAAGDYYLGGGSVSGSGAVYVPYMRFIYPSANGNTGSTDTPSLLVDTVNDVDFAATYNSVNYLSATTFIFRESSASILSFNVYFDTARLAFVVIASSASSASETVTVDKNRLTKTGYTYPTKTYLYANSTTNTVYELNAASQATKVKFSLSSSTTTVVPITT